MSTPVDLNIVMPYGVTVEGNGSRNARIVTNSAQASSDIALKLPDGPCRVAASWDGPEAVRLVHTGHGYPVTIPAGGVSLRDGCYRRYEGRNDLPAERFVFATRGGRARHHRGLPAQLRVAHRAVAVV